MSFDNALLKIHSRLTKETSSNQFKMSAGQNKKKLLPFKTVFWNYEDARRKTEANRSSFDAQHSWKQRLPNYCCAACISCFWCSVFFTLKQKVWMQQIYGQFKSAGEKTKLREVEVLKLRKKFPHCLISRNYTCVVKFSDIWWASWFLKTRAWKIMRYHDKFKIAGEKTRLCERRMLKIA